MIDRLQAPLGMRQLAATALAASAAVTLYCLAYTALAGRSESPVEALAWTVVNVLPWLAAFEAAKRFRSIASKGLVLAGALAASLVLAKAIGDWGGFGFEAVRRVPGLLIVGSLLAAGALASRRRSPTPTERSELPLPPGMIDWVSAAGNYVELHGCGRVVLHREPLSSVEGRLARSGFVRIHRSILVRRDRIARIRREDLLLLDGTALRIGKRYRALVGRENLEPSSLRSGERALESP